MGPPDWWPSTVVKSKSIECISLCGFEGFLRDVFPSIIWSWMSPTNSLSSLVKTFAGMSSLTSVDLTKSSLHGLSSLLKELPKLQSLWLEYGCEPQLIGVGDEPRVEATTNNDQLLNIKSYALFDHCRSQVQISGSNNSLSSLSIQMGLGMTCQVINILKKDNLKAFLSIKKNNLKKLARGLGDSTLFIPCDSSAKPLAFSCKGSSIIFKVPPMNGRNLKRMTLHIAYSSSPDNITVKGCPDVWIISYSKTAIEVYKGDSITFFEDEERRSVISNLEPGNKVEVIVQIGHGLLVDNTAVYLMYD